ncbi:MAG: hypothetical protein ACRD2P_14230, partial [Terriglobia bacterium]
ARGRRYNHTDVLPATQDEPPGRRRYRFLVDRGSLPGATTHGQKSTDRGYRLQNLGNNLWHSIRMF